MFVVFKEYKQYFSQKDTEIDNALNRKLQQFQARRISREERLRNARPDKLLFIRERNVREERQDQEELDRVTNAVSKYYIARDDFFESIQTLTGNIEGQLSSSLGSISECINILEYYLATQSAGNTGQNNSGEITGLASTQQGFIRERINSQDVIVFDHPRESARNAIFNQGSAHPDYQGTCGCCASGTIMREAGYSFTEQNVVGYAVSNNLCQTNSLPEHNGGTSPENRNAIIEGMTGGNVTARASVGVSLSDLAIEVENGRGVILSVNPRFYAPEMYGDGGHAVVLSSVVRNANTNDITGYYIIDSNGHNPDTALRYVSERVLNRAYEDRNMRANVTVGIIR